MCPCGAPVTVELPSQAPPADTDQDGPAQPTVKPCGACGRLLVVDDPNIGRVVQGKWRLERRLGQGGMGTVYLAVETAVDRQVALKFLHPQLADREEYRSRFELEARVMARVEHPNLVGLLGVERDGAVPFLVMRFVQGQPLSRLMKERRVFTLDETLPLVVQVAAALSALHAKGYVHRDLKPGNVMVSEEGHVTLLDFGLTRDQDTNLTRPGVALGSPQYMSPEQVMTGALDGRSDLYTLALLTSELLVGRRPYKDEETKASLTQHLHEAPEPAHVGNPRVPEAVSKVLLKAMAKKPQERFPSVEDFVQDLLAAAKVTTVPLPRRETAEAMLASLALPRPSEAGQAEVAEVLSPETASLSTPVRKPKRGPTRRDENSASVELKTEQYTAWPDKTVPMPAWSDDEPVEPEGARTDRRPAVHRTDEVPLPGATSSSSAPLLVGVAVLLLIILAAGWVLLS